ncbi:MAG TPA: hypothetical protein VK846_12340, partial [Candidatus Limnocylindria bacterium]|nr:hypothetical protein [Candidatus Limnocylindria bacterium]
IRSAGIVSIKKSEVFSEAFGKRNVRPDSAEALHVSKNRLQGEAERLHASKDALHASINAGLVAKDELHELREEQSVLVAARHMSKGGWEGRRDERRESRDGLSEWTVGQRDKHAPPTICAVGRILTCRRGDYRHYCRTLVSTVPLPFNVCG